jgi:prepilin signal peptidase PulO-like enzyme (type II secretory pathway)
MFLYLTALLFAYLGNVLAKFFSVRVIIESQNLKESLFKDRIEYFIFLTTPFLIIFRPKIFSKKIRSFREKIIVSELLGLISLLLYFSSIYYFYDNNSYDQSEIFSVILHVGFSLLIMYFLVFLAIFDIFTFTIPSKTLRQVTLLAILMNVGVILLTLSSNQELSQLTLGKPQNLLAGIILGGLMILIRRVTNDKGLGDGDVELIAALGLVWGLANSFSFIFFTIMIGGVISLFYAIILRKFKDVIVPFVPFVLLGFALTIGFGKPFFELIFN